MRRLLPNHLLGGVLSMIALYWILFPLFDRPSGSNAVSILSICAGIFLFVQYMEATGRILFKQERREGYVAILSASFVAMGVIVSGLYVLIWNRMGQPPDWISSASSSFGRALLTGGLFGMGFSHQITRLGGDYPTGFWRAVLIAFAIIVAFIAGANYASP